MFSDFLWFLGAKQQHDRQMELGLAGLSGLLMTIFMVWKWDSIFYPIFEKLGFVGLAARLGLINNDMEILTVINILAAIFFVCLVFAVGLLVVVIGGAILLTFGSTPVGKYVVGIPMFILFSPIIFIMMLYVYSKLSSQPERKDSLYNTYKRDPELKPLLKEYRNLDHRKQEQLLEYYIKQEERDGITIRSSIECQSILNRAVASITDDRNWLFGYNSDADEMYILFPNPMPAYASKCADVIPFRIREGMNKYRECYIQYEIGNPPNPLLGFYVPSLDVKLVWNHIDKKIELRIEDDASIQVRRTNTMRVYDINNEEVASLFDSVSLRKDLVEYNDMVHSMLYLLPIVYPTIDSFSDDYYNEEVRQIPNTDVYFHIYAASVYEKIQFMGEQQNIEWAKNWLAKNKIEGELY